MNQEIFETVAIKPKSRRANNTVVVINLTTFMLGINCHREHYVALSKKKVEPGPIVFEGNFL